MIGRRPAKLLALLGAVLIMEESMEVAVMSGSRQLLTIESSRIIIAFERCGATMVGTHAQLSREQFDSVLGNLSVAEDWVKSP